MPAFGRPTSPASAISFSRSQSVRSTPSCPGLALRGAWLVDDLKRRLPQPPLPPRASITRCPGRVRSATRVSPSSSRISVPTGTLQHDVVGAPAGALLAHAGLAVPGEEMLLVAIVDQRVQPVDRLGDHVAALAAVAAVRAAELDELLAAEADAAVPAGAGADLDAGMVEELHRVMPRAGAGSGTSAPSRPAPARGSRLRPRRRSRRGSAPGSRPGCPGRPRRRARAARARRPRTRPPRPPRRHSRCPRTPARPSSRSPPRRRRAASARSARSGRSRRPRRCRAPRPGRARRARGARSTKLSARPGG